MKLLALCGKKLQTEINKVMKAKRHDKNNYALKVMWGGVMVLTDSTAAGVDAVRSGVLAFYYLTKQPWSTWLGMA